MKRNLLLSLFLTLFSVLSIHAQQDTVLFRVGVNCPGQTFLFNAKALVEGQTYTLEGYTLPTAYSHLQPLYNSLLGSTFTIEEGAINEKIRVDWILNELDCTNGGYLPINGAALLFNSHYTVSRWVDNDWFPVTGDYNFLDSKKAVLSIKNSQAFQTFRLAVPLYVNDIAFVFQIAGGTFIPTGLTLDIPSDTTDVNAFWVIKAAHLSTIVGGPKDQLTGIEDSKLNNNIPSDFVLNQNYPNPFNPSTFIEYSVPQRTNVEINVYNILGVKIATLFSGTKEAGNYRINFDAGELASGIYIYEMKTSHFVQSRKMLFMK